MVGPAAERGILLNGLLATLRLSAEPMVLTDPHQPDNPLIAVNRPFETLTQYTEAELSGRNCRLLQGPETDRRAVRQLGNCLRQGASCVQFLANYRRDGSTFYNLLFVSPVHGHDGQLHFFLASQHNLCADGSLRPSEFPLGPAHMLPGQQTEFRLLLLDIAHEVAAAAGAPSLPARVRALEAALAAAREISGIATRLKPGAPI